MQVYSMQCSCGQISTVDANSRKEAVDELISVMTQEALDKHLRGKHNGTPKLTLEKIHQQIEHQLIQGVPS